MDKRLPVDGTCLVLVDTRALRNESENSRNPKPTFDRYSTFDYEDLSPFIRATVRLQAPLKSRHEAYARIYPGNDGGVVHEPFVQVKGVGFWVSMDCAYELTFNQA